MKELSTETRLLLATVLSISVIAVWGYLYRPPAPQKPPQSPVSTGGGQPQTPPPSVPPPIPSASAPVPPPPEGAVATAPRVASAESTIVIESKLYRTKLSNRGAVVQSWELKNHNDDKGHTLDVVHAETCKQLGGWPLALSLDDAQVEAAANGALFEVTSAGKAVEGTVRAPAEIDFAWSDGRISVTKRLKFAAGYIVELETSVLVDGKPVPHSIAWRGGFGDDTVFQPAEQVYVVYHSNDKLYDLAYKKLGVSGNPAQRALQVGQFDYAGIMDHYFAAAFLPADGPALLLWHWKLERETEVEGKKAMEPVSEMAVGSSVAGPLRLRLFVGPKDVDELAGVKPPLSDLVQFGWFGLLSRPLLLLLQWIHRYVPNYGWAIILMTILINLVLFPLKVQSWRSMQKMQKVAPEVRQIQDRYKKYSLRDPRRQEMNQEVMAVYKREGINPVGGCVPQLLQMPIWIALYQMLRLVIELRHAPWILWIRDLSARDPYYILPVLMGVTMYLMQKMTPVTYTDDAQARMMKLMPIMFGGMFVIFPVASGLVLYILTSNLVGMAQQWYLNRGAPATSENSKGMGGKSSRKK